MSSYPLGHDDSKPLPLGSLPLVDTHEREPLPPPFHLVLGYAKISFPISKVGGRFFPLNSGSLSVPQAVWNRAVLCSHSTWLKNVRNVELYFPPSFLSSFLFLNSAFGRSGARGVFCSIVWSFSVVSGGVPPDHPSGCGQTAGVCVCVRFESRLSPHPVSLHFPVSRSVPRFKLKQAGKEGNSLANTE